MKYIFKKLTFACLIERLMVVENVVYLQQNGICMYVVLHATIFLVGDNVYGRNIRPFINVTVVRGEGKQQLTINQGKIQRTFIRDAHVPFVI